jgi:hypothetical protein
METNQVYDERCDHCIHNPNATKPYAHMKKLNIDSEVTSELEKQGLNPSCYMCRSARRILEVNRKLQKNKKGELENGKPTTQKR